MQSLAEWQEKNTTSRERRVISACGFSGSFACRPFNAAVNLPRPHPDQKSGMCETSLAEYPNMQRKLFSTGKKNKQKILKWVKFHRLKSATKLKEISLRIFFFYSCVERVYYVDVFCCRNNKH